MNRPQFRRTGGTMQFVSYEDGYQILLDRFQEKSGDIKAHVRVQQVVDGKITGTLSLSKPDLVSPRSRAEIAKECAARESHVDWSTVLLHVFDRAEKEFRKGNPFVDLSKTKPDMRIPYLVRPLIPLGETTIIYGPGGTGKSTIARAIGVYVRLGRNLPGVIEPQEQGNVLILDYETNEQTNAREIWKLAAGMGVDSPRIIYRECHRPITEEADLIAEQVAADNVSLVIIDSLAPASGSDPQNPGVATAAMNAIRSIGATRLVLAHVAKGSVEAGMPTSVFGSVFYTNLARSIWELKAPAEQPSEDQIELALFHRKVNSGPLRRKPIGLVVKHEDDLVTLSTQQVTLDSSLSQGLSIPEQLRMAMSRGPRKVQDMADELGFRETSVRAALRRMKDVMKMPGTGEGGKGAEAQWCLKQPIDMFKERPKPKIKPEDQCRYCANELTHFDETGTIPLCDLHAVSDPSKGVREG